MYSLIIADDEPENLAGLCTLVSWQELGFDLKATFSDGESALKWLKDNQTDVLLTDIVMNDVSGLDLAHWLHMNSPASRVVLVSAYDRFDLAQKAIEEKVFRFLVKPTRISELIKNFSELREELDRDKNVHSDADGRDEHHIVRQVCDYVNTHIDKSISLQEISEILHYNPSYLSRLFKKEHGEGFNDYVNRLKIKRACQLLREGNLRIYEVASKVGFRDVRYFTRLFSNLTGKMPSDYRKRHDL